MHRLKLYVCFTNKYRSVLDDYFLPSLCDDFDLQLRELEGAASGDYMSDEYARILSLRHEMILKAINENRGDVLAFSDADIQFFRPVKEALLKALGDKDIVCMRDSPGENGLLCAGFFVMRANERTRLLWKCVKERALKEKREQLIMNRVIKRSQTLWGRLYYRCPKIAYGYLPQNFFGAGTFSGTLWKPGMDLKIPENPAVHHANWTTGIENKSAQLSQVRKMVNNNNHVFAAL